MTDLDHVENAAVRACRDGGAYLREAFRADERDGEFTPHDVKAVTDRESERRMLDVVLDAFPNHHVYAEESGDHPPDGDADDGPYRWIVDPLDGTNNFTAGLPSFATSAAVLRDDDLLATTKAIYDGLASRCKRVVQSWSPCVHWGLFARGLFDGMVTFHPDKEEQRAGELFASEAGAASRSWDGRYVATGNEDALSDLCEVIESAR